MNTNTLLAVTLLSSFAVAQCISAPGANVVVTQDSITGPNPIGFAFPFNGGTYTDIHISDHGICFLTNGGIPAPPAAVPLVYSPSSPSLVANGPVICPLWGDSIPGANGMFFIDAQASTCTVTWVDIQSFGFPLPEFTIQLVLHSNGNIVFNYGPNATNNSTFGGISDNGVVGVSPGTPAVLPASSDFSAGVATSDATVFEEFIVANGFDMAGDSVLLVPGLLGGWTVTTSPNCAGSGNVGAGCNGLTMTSDDPVIGNNWTLTISGVDPISPVTFTFFALSLLGTPVDLTPNGAPGCFCYIDSLVVRVLSPVVAGSSTAVVAIPNDPGLVGLPLNAQTLAFTNANAGGFSSSDALQGIVGN